MCTTAACHVARELVERQSEHVEGEGKDLQIVSACIRVYLLEVTRVVFQAPLSAS